MNAASSRFPPSVALWICVAALGAAGLAFGILPLDRARERAVSQEAAAAATRTSDLRFTPWVARRPALVPDRSSETGTMLRAIFSASAMRGMRVVSIVPDVTDAGRAPSASDYTVGVEGRFRDLLAYLQAISECGALVDVRSADVHLARAWAEDGAPPLLDSTVHITLYGAGVAR